MNKRVVLITGAGIGIGRACALCFAGLGDHVIVTDVLEAEGKAVVSEIEFEGGSAEFHTLDVRSTEASNALIDDLTTRFGFACDEERRVDYLPDFNHGVAVWLG